MQTQTQPSSAIPTPSSSSLPRKAQTQPSSAISTPYTTHDSINHEKESGFGKKEWNITTKNSSRHMTLSAEYHDLLNH
jgi:hypothetical protein